MKPKLSELKIEDFAILDCNYSFISPKKLKKSDAFDPEIFDNYEIDIDYTIAGLDNVGRIFMDVSINTGQTVLNGYSLNIKGALLYHLDDKLTKEEQASLTTSAIAITLNNIRSFISQMTGLFPFGRYNMPAIDLGDLVNRKNDEIITNATQHKKRTKSTKI